MKIYIVLTEGIMDQSDSFIDIEKICLSRRRAIEHLKKIVESDKKINPDWYNDSRYCQEWAEDSAFFEVYEDGNYCDNHFTVQVKQVKI